MYESVKAGIETPYILTASGGKVYADGRIKDVPLIDFDRALNRVPRFSGQTRKPWTVANHSLVVYEMTKVGREQACGLHLAALLHDAHEAFTGDIGTPLKPMEIRVLQHELDRSISAWAFGADDRTMLHDFHGALAEYDRRALLAEALVVGPDCLQTTPDVVDHFGTAPRHEDCAIVLKVLDRTERWAPSGLRAINTANPSPWAEAVQFASAAYTKYINAPSEGSTPVLKIK